MHRRQTEIITFTLRVLLIDVRQGPLWYLISNLRWVELKETPISLEMTRKWQRQAGKERCRETERGGGHLYNFDFPFGLGIIRLSFAPRSSICPQLSCSRIRYNGSAIDSTASTESLAWVPKEQGIECDYGNNWAWGLPSYVRVFLP